jgi:gamma-glutamyltranspeptidase/glutathione hydrolase
MASQPAPDRPFRPNVMARHHIVVSGHYWASQAGFQILEAGGNAIDAGVATALATYVLQSEFTGFGGVGPTMIYLAERREVVTISGVGPWPKAASCDYFHRHHGGRVPAGVLETVVPAAPANLLGALRRYGTMSFAEVAGAAIRFARDGFPMYPMMAERLEEMQGDFARWDSTAAIFMPNGRLPQVGEIFVQRDLAATLQHMADEETAHRSAGREAGIDAAHDAFYKGDIAAAIVAHQRAHSGLLAAEDLAGFEAAFEAPCKVRVMGDLDVYGCGPWCQGPMLLEALNILDGFDLRAMGHNTPAYIHTVTEALKLAAADREVYFGDPDFVSVPLDEILSAPFAARRRALLRPDRAWPEMPPFAAIAGYDKQPWKPDPASGPEPRKLLETSYLCVADRAGNVYSITPSDPTISGLVVPGTGITASSWGSRAYTDPGHPACVGPGRRPRMSANPMLAIRGDSLVMPFGSPGSEVLGQSQIQALLNVQVFGMSPQAAVEAPRFASYSWPASALPHEYHPGRLTLEADIGLDVGAALAQLGHDVTWWPTREWLAGSVCTIMIDPRTGLKQGGADHRLTAYAVGW